MKKIFFVMLVISLLCAPLYAQGRDFKGTVEGDEPAVKFLKMIVDTVKPESVQMIVEGTGEDGKFGRIAVFVTGSSYKDYRLEYCAVDLSFAEFNPPSEWTDDWKSIKLKNFLRGNMEIRANDGDVNRAIVAFLQEQEAKQKDKSKLSWANVKVSFKNDKIYATGRFAAGGVSGTAAIETAVEIREGKQLWLKDTRVDINDAETDVIKKEIAKVEKLFDVRDLGYSVTLRQISFRDGVARLATQTAPVFDSAGIVYTYTK